MELLKKLGLTKYESLVYTSLLKYGRSNGVEICDKSSVPQTAVYPALKSLVARGLVNHIQGDPALFEALPPEIALKHYVEKKEKELSKLKDEAVKFAKELKKEPKSEKKKEVLWLTQGRPLSVASYKEACTRARKSFYILGWSLEKVGDKYMFLRILRDLVKKGVDVRIILHGTREKKKDLIKDYKEEGIKIKYIPLEGFSIFVMDSEECKITLKDKKLGNRYNVHIQDGSLAKAMNSYFLDLWDKAEEIN